MIQLKAKLITECNLQEKAVEKIINFLNTKLTLEETLKYYEKMFPNQFLLKREELNTKLNEIKDIIEKVKNLYELTRRITNEFSFTSKLRTYFPEILIDFSLNNEKFGFKGKDNFFFFH